MPEAKTYDATALARLSADLEGQAPQDVLRWAVQEFQPGLTLACSFGGPSGMVLLDMLMPTLQQAELRL